jgi:ABC-type multidrug transport system ATPase subunit
LTLAPGEVVGISGANGSGKTTFVRILATLQRPSHGSGSILGVDIAESDLSGARQRIGLIGHTPALIPELSLRENLTHIARLSGIDEGRIDPVLEVVGLDEAGDRRSDAASFGMKRRAEIAHILLRKPQLLLLDEAVSGLDEAASELIDALVETTTDRGGATVMVSHDRSYLDAKCQRTMRLATGTLEVNG